MAQHNRLMFGVGWKRVDSCSRAVLFSRKARSSGCTKLGVLIEMQFADNTSRKAFAPQQLVLRLKVAVRHLFHLKTLVYAHGTSTFVCNLQQATASIRTPLSPLAKP